MSWLLHFRPDHLVSPMCRRQLFHSSPAVGGKNWRPKSKRTSAKGPSVLKKPQFQRDDVPHSHIERTSSSEEDGAQPSLLAGAGGPASGRRRWGREVAQSSFSARDGRRNEPVRFTPRAEPSSPLRAGSAPAPYVRSPAGIRRSTTPTRSDHSKPSKSRSHYSDSQSQSQPSTFRSRHDDSTPHESRSPPPYDDSQGIPNSISHKIDVPSTHLQKIVPVSVPDGGFTSPPLMEGLVNCLKIALGPNAKPTPIQTLSIQHLLEDTGGKYKECLLASETGSGKSIAYMLPLLQSLKQSELDGTVNRQRTHPLNPRALVLAPTHELARQLSTFAKSLIHDIKLRVLCASQANVNNKVDAYGGTARSMKNKLDFLFDDNHELDIRAEGRFPVDVIVGTPMKLLSMVKGRGWDRRMDEDEKSTKKAPEKEEDEDAEEGEKRRKFRKGRDIELPKTGRTGNSPSELGLINVDWVIVDEADVLFDPDFQETTRLLLSEIAAERGSPVPYFPDTFNFHNNNTAIEAKPVAYPFNLVLTSATIPNALNNYLQIHHPSHARLTSPKLHHLPTSLQTEYVGYTGGNKMADIEKRVRKVWSEDSVTRSGQLSKVLVFCNKNTKVQALSQHLEEKGIKSIAIDGSPESRPKGSNRHLEGFLRKPLTHKPATEEESDEDASDISKTPHVLITTSLLSRGIDFSPQIKHVFIVDEPRNMIDFLHRAGRSGRAGQIGKVVVFGKLEGRGSSRAKDVRMRVAKLR